MTNLEEKANNSLPEVIQGWQRTGAYDFEKETPGGGVGIEYALENAVATIYIYDQKLGAIPSGISSNMIKKEFAVCRDAISIMQRQGIYQSAKKTGEGKTKLGLTNRTDALFAKFNIKINDVKKTSWLYMTAFKNHYYKVRMSYPNGEVEDKELKAFLNSLTDRVLGL